MLRWVPWEPASHASHVTFRSSLSSSLPNPVPFCADPYCSFLILPTTIFRRQHRSPTVLLSIPFFCLNRPSLQLPEALPVEQWATQAREAGRQSSELYTLSFAPNPIPRLIPSSVADSQLWLLLFLSPISRRQSRS